MTEGSADGTQRVEGDVIVSVAREGVMMMCAKNTVVATEVLEPCSELSMAMPGCSLSVVVAATMPIMASRTNGENSMIKWFVDV